MKGRDFMTIEELKEALSRVPKKGAINKAIRQSILERIYAIMQGGNTNG